jgi:PHD/YefM family antitoxin component YafN of YafNO toxin-antitoxin module
MDSLNIQIIKKNGKKEYVILPYEEFLKVQEELDDYEDLRCLREAKKAEQDAPIISIEELRNNLNIHTK